MQNNSFETKTFIKKSEISFFCILSLNKTWAEFGCVGKQSWVRSASDLILIIWTARNILFICQNKDTYLLFRFRWARQCHIRQISVWHFYCLHIENIWFIIVYYFLQTKNNNILPNIFLNVKFDVKPTF